MDEFFDIVDENNKVVGRASRRECHGNPALIHRTVHVVVFHPDGRLLLQKRSLDKDLLPGLWDTAVGGHLDLGETFEDAARREFSEELGIDPPDSFDYLFDSKIRNDIESENVRVFSYIHSGPFRFQKEEIDEVRFWEFCELRKAIKESPAIFTPNVILEIERLMDIYKDKFKD